MTTRIILILMTAFTFSCSKHESQPDVSACLREMKNIFADDLTCREQNVYEVNLYVGTYQGETVYFTNTMCPACNVIPPAYGYTCDKKKVTFTHFAEISEVREVYNSCTKKFME